MGLNPSIRFWLYLQMIQLVRATEKRPEFYFEEFLEEYSPKNPHFQE